MDVNFRIQRSIALKVLEKHGMEYEHPVDIVRLANNYFNMKFEAINTVDGKIVLARMSKAKSLSKKPVLSVNSLVLRRYQRLGIAHMLGEYMMDNKYRLKERMIFEQQMWNHFAVEVLVPDVIEIFMENMTHPAITKLSNEFDVFPDIIVRKLAFMGFSIPPTYDEKTVFIKK